MNLGLVWKNDEELLELLLVCLSEWFSVKEVISKILLGFKDWFVCSVLVVGFFLLFRFIFILGLLGNKGLGGWFSRLNRGGKCVILLCIYVRNCLRLVGGFMGA